MSVSVPSMNSMARMSGPLSGPLSSLLGYEGSLMVGAAPATSPRTSPHHAGWGCPPIQVKQEPSERDADSSGVSSMAHGSSFMSGMSGANTSPSSSSSAGSPPGHHGQQALHGYQHATPTLQHRGGLQGGVSPRRGSPASPASPGSVASTPVHSTPLAPHPGHLTAAAPPPAPVSAPASSPHGEAPAKVPRTPGSVDDNNSRSSSCSNSEDDAEEHLRRLRATLEGANMDASDAAASHAGSAPFKCRLCDFATAVPDDLRAHLHDSHDLQMSQMSQMSPDPTACDDQYGDHDDDGVSTPRVNSQGKVKTFRCKQCEFVAVTKLDFWEHTKLHIKQEKLLCCPKCPFVTEYKHHLEYHLRNHFNSKPFKCDKCPYSCVNKSMLNSHLKSHSNVYQYRCADCTYATKYCHSLKLHLRKYNHQPSMVLNPDGTPNPLPIIDVYGTRRGPKTKTSKAAQAALQQQLQQQQQQQQQLQMAPQQFGMFQNPYGLPPLFPYGAAPAAQDLPAPTAPRQGSPPLHRCNYCDFSTHEAEVLAQHLFVHAESNWMQYFSANNNNYYQDEKEVKPALTLPGRQSSPPAAPAPAPALSPPRTPSSPTGARVAASPSAGPDAPAALDLSKPEQTPGLHPGHGHGGEEVRETKNRRKGRAFKLERIAMRLQHHDSGDEAENEPAVKMPRLDAAAANATNAPTPVRVPAASPEPKALSLRSPPASPPTSPASATGKEEYNCTYCDIAFGDIVMYTMHMGYHGYQDPFKCNMCGHQTTDKVSFFLHIARSSHS